LLTLLDEATKVMQDEMIKNVSNIEKYQPVSLLHDQFVLMNSRGILENFEELYLDKFLRWTPNFERGSTSRDNFYGSSGTWPY
jgi:hypothetical protein